MNSDPLYCTSDTRISEVKYLLKKYDCKELVVIDSIEEKHPIGFINMEVMNTNEVIEADIPSDVSAGECMYKISAVAEEHSSLNECLNIMRNNQMEIIPIVDYNGHYVGLLEKTQLVNKLM